MSCWLLPAAYFDVLRAQAVLKVAKQTVAARQLVSDQIYRPGAEPVADPQLDVTFANVNLSDAKLLQLQAENGINSAEAELATALGLPNQTTFDVADEPMPAALPAQADPLIAQAMQNRPDLKNLQLPPVRRRTFHARRARSLLPHSQRLGGRRRSSSRSVPGS